MYQIYPCGQKNAILSTQKRQRCHINQYFGSETDYVNLIGSRNSTRAATLLFQLRTAAFKAYCAIWVRRSNFRHQASPRVSPRESTQRRNVELWARNVREFYLNADLRVTFRDLLHAVKLRHGTDCFTSPPK